MINRKNSQRAVLFLCRYETKVLLNVSMGAILKKSKGKQTKKGKTQMNLKALIYTRGHNIEGQYARCEYYIEMAGYELIGHITEGEIHKDLGEIDVVIIAEASRLSRNIEEYFSIREKIENKGIRIEIASKDNAVDSLTMQIIEMMRNQYK